MYPSAEVLGLCYHSPYCPYTTGSFKSGNPYKPIYSGTADYGVESDRYETVVRPNRRKRRIFEKVKRLFYLKYHIVAILDYLIILKVSVTSYRAADCTTLRRMLKSLSSFPGSVFEADRGFDAEYIFKKVYSLMMFPNIKQKKEKGRERKDTSKYTLLST
jgi:hypothetical protein